MVLNIINISGTHKAIKQDSQLGHLNIDFYSLHFVLSIGIYVVVSNKHGQCLTLCVEDKLVWAP